MRFGIIWIRLAEGARLVGIRFRPPQQYVLAPSTKIVPAYFSAPDLSGREEFANAENLRTHIFRRLFRRERAESFGCGGEFPVLESAHCIPVGTKALSGLLESPHSNRAREMETSCNFLQQSEACPSQLPELGAEMPNSK